MIGSVNRLSAVKTVLQLLLLPLMCLGFLCGAGLPLCAPMHHCAHDEAFAEMPAALPPEGCSAEHGTQCEEEHFSSRFELMFSAAPRVRTVGSAAVSTMAAEPLPLTALPVLSAGMLRAHAPCMARHRGALYRGHLQPQRC